LGDTALKADVIETGWLWASAIACVAAVLAPDFVPHNMRTGLATMVFLELIGAVLVIFALAKAKHLNSFPSTAVALAYFSIGFVVTAIMVGQEPFALLGLAALIRIGYDAYSYARATTVHDELLQARKYFIIFYQAIFFPLVLVPTVFAHGRFTPVAAHRLCESSLCIAVNPPDRFLVTGAIVYPLLAMMATFWKPRWMDWTLTPR
jgi:uncharacterized membrane protein YeaQ/YmgE (transglycosylase-associated protein family)